MVTLAPNPSAGAALLKKCNFVMVTVPTGAKQPGAPDAPAPEVAAEATPQASRAAGLRAQGPQCPPSAETFLGRGGQSCSRGRTSFEAQVTAHWIAWALGQTTGLPSLSFPACHQLWQLQEGTGIRLEMAKLGSPVV